MNSKGQRHYSVLTRAEIHEKIMKEVVQISQVFSLSLSDATVILIHLRWNSFKASDHLGEDKDKFLSELGLVGSKSPSDEDLEVIGEGDANLVSTPLCSHKFCTDCWRDYLSKSLEKKKEEEERVLLISCLSQDCVASVGPDTIEKLTESVKEIYERYVLGTFVESNNETIKWCPDPDCDYAIERHDYDPSEDFDVVCLCGHIFCWSCQLESHLPVTCNNASLWLNQLLDESRNLAVISKRIKHCPECRRLVKHHDGVWSCNQCYASPPSNESALIRHMTLWDANHRVLQMSKSDLEAIEPKIMDANSGLREAWMLILQCRRILKWSCVFGYFISDYHIAKKQYLDLVREKATTNLVTHKRTLHEVTTGVISGGDVTVFRQKLRDTTTRVGNFFHNFVKLLEDGLSDVKVDAYEDVTTDYWFCDRCTFKNDCFDQECRMCVFSFESPPHVAFGHSNSSTSSHQQQQVLDASNDPLPSQGGTK
ncbi:unnamed protein product [Eruca vesicaria subsp. sativa]|uniref:RBR-type E3 ubiquitin transferase n=1 Tax=Eruca vesicaria subsp. sativa TaxID=29727 RepID=A0ABC8L5X6_ERUVS|nr:unnamed protein product [Eruca vesicaria subsp. sativa]